jgi:cytochrome b561
LTLVSRYHPLLVVLHWVLAFFIIAALALGALALVKIPNTDPAKIEGLRAHMSGGMIILVLMLIRLVVRTRSAHPAPASAGQPLLDRLAWVSHRLFYVTVIAMACSGIIMALQTGTFHAVFFAHGQVPADFWAYSIRSVHYALSRLLMALIGLHIVAALYHALVLRDGLLSRMFFGRRTIEARFARQQEAIVMAKRIVPWISRAVLIAAFVILALIGRKFVVDPVGAAAASDMTLGSPLAITNMRASFGAFPLGCALFVLICLVTSNMRGIGLVFVALIIGTALVVRTLGSLADGSLAQSLHFLIAETVLLSLSLAAYVAERLVSDNSASRRA